MASTAAPRKAKKAGGSIKPAANFTTRTVEVKLTSIVSNEAQSRGMGVLSGAQEAGYGVFEPLEGHEDNKPLWDLLVSDDPDERALGISVMDKYENEPEEEKGKVVEREPSLVATADSIRRHGQSQPVGLWQDADGNYDVIFGMRRCLAVAYNYASDPDNHPGTIQAKVYEGDLGIAQRRILALVENKDRKKESPIDKAITFKQIMKDNDLSPDEFGASIGFSGQHIRNYTTKLLHPKIEDLRMKIHLGTMSVDAAMRTLAKRQAEGRDDAEARQSDQDTKKKMPSNKRVVKILEAKRKPKNLKEEDWEWFINPTIRQFYCHFLDLDEKEYGEYVEPPPEEPKPPKEKAKGKGKKGKAEDESRYEGKKVLKVRKDRAVALLISCGQMNARTYSEDTLRDKLEDIPNQGELEPTSPETYKRLHEKLTEWYKAGDKVKIVKE